jgi:cobalt/nickel transport system permease protein
MINFTIPATGSSCHIGGGLLLAILLGPHAAFLTLASVLFIQALFFADGGLLALGCNIFNLGIFPAFVAYPLVYQPLVGSRPRQSRLVVVTVIAAVIGLQLGAFAVVLETVASGISALPFVGFALLMQPIHLAIGVIEGLATAAVIAFIYRARPELVGSSLQQRLLGNLPLPNMLLGLVTATILLGGVVSWFASEHPDGLEWSIARMTGSEELPKTEFGIHDRLALLQEKLAFLPDYAFPAPGGDGEGPRAGRLRTTTARIVAGIITLALCALIGIVLRKRPRKG